MSEFKDCFGQEIKVGSKVAFISSNCRSPGGSLKAGATVVRLTPKKVGIVLAHPGGRPWLVFPDKIVVAPTQ